MDASVQCNLLSSVVNSDASVQCDFVPVPLVTSTPRKGFMVQSESDISEPDEEEAVNTSAGSYMYYPTQESTSS